MTQSDSSRCCPPTTRENVYSILKICLILYNFFFMLFSFLLIGLGIYSEVMRSMITEMDHVFLTPSVFLFIMGFVMLMFSFFGCVSALRDNLCFLRILNASILVLIVLEVGAGITALVFKEPAKNFVNKYVLKGMVTYYDDQDLKNVVDFVQEEFACCGGRFYKDWEVNPYHNCSAPGPSACGVPYSCCVKETEDDLVINSMCGYDTIQLKGFEAVDIVYQTGCIDAVIDFLWMNLDILAGILLGIFVPQMTGIILGLLYLDLIKKFLSSQADPSSEKFM